MIKLRAYLLKFIIEKTKIGCIEKVFFSLKSSRVPDLPPGRSLPTPDLLLTTKGLDFYKIY